ncbi:LOW QUALITY PROTEIN: hypothetical protein YC2023_040978 [Brassica napus]
MKEPSLESQTYIQLGLMTLQEFFLIVRRKAELLLMEQCQSVSNTPAEVEGSSLAYEPTIKAPRQVINPTTHTPLAVKTSNVLLSQRSCGDSCTKRPSHSTKTPAHDTFTFNRFGCLDSCGIMC